MSISRLPSIPNITSCNKSSYLCLNTFSFFLITLIIGATIYAVLPRNEGDQNAPYGKHPYVVGLSTSSSIQNWLCSGSIIHKRWILTAAHCLFKGTNTSTWVIIRKSRSWVVDESQDYPSEYTVTHKGHRRNPALVRVAKDIQFNENVQPIQLTKENFNKVRYPVTETDWAQNETTNLGIVKTVGHCVCKRTLNDTNKNHFCTVTRNERVKPIKSNTGGPLVADGVQIGIFTGAYDICDSKYVNQYHKVYAYLDWITTERAKFDD